MEEKRPKVSVVIMTQNRVETLKQAIEAVFNQTFKDYELFVILGAHSQDASHQMLTELAAKGLLKFVVNTGSRIDARNMAFERTSGEYVCFLDDDDTMLKNRLEVQSRILDENPNIGVVSCATMLSKQTALMHTLKNMSMSDILRLLEEGNDIDEVINFQSCMFRRSAVDNVFPTKDKFEELFIAGGEGQFFLYQLIVNGGVECVNTANTIYIYQVCYVQNSLTLNVTPTFYNEYLFGKSWDIKKDFVRNFYTLFPKKEKTTEEHPEVSTETPTESPKKKRGRKKKVVETIEEPTEAPKRKRGRPKKTDKA